MIANARCGYGMIWNAVAMGLAGGRMMLIQLAKNLEPRRDLRRASLLSFPLHLPRSSRDLVLLFLPTLHQPSLLFNLPVVLLKENLYY